MSVTADPGARPYVSSNARSTRPSRKSADYDPLEQRIKRVADLIWERASNIASVLAPERPVDAAEVGEQDSWMLLERVALDLSPYYWDDPAAIQDLIDLRRKFAPQMPTEKLSLVLRLAKQAERMKPDITITPENPEWDKREARLKR